MAKLKVLTIKKQSHEKVLPSELSFLTELSPVHKVLHLQDAVTRSQASFALSRRLPGGLAGPGPREHLTVGRHCPAGRGAQAQMTIWFFLERECLESPHGANWPASLLCVTNGQAGMLVFWRGQTFTVL